MISSARSRPLLPIPRTRPPCVIARRAASHRRANNGPTISTLDASTSSTSREQSRSIDAIESAAKLRDGERYARWVSAALWIGVAAALVGLGFAIGAWLESGLLGFIGADLVFVLIMAFYTSVHDASQRKQR